jgi:hypothetical protein
MNWDDAVFTELKSEKFMAEIERRIKNSYRMNWEHAIIVERKSDACMKAVEDRIARHFENRETINESIPSKHICSNHNDNNDVGLLNESTNTFYYFRGERQIRRESEQAQQCNGNDFQAYAETRGIERDGKDRRSCY